MSIACRFHNAVNWNAGLIQVLENLEGHIISIFQYSGLERLDGHSIFSISISRSGKPGRSRHFSISISRSGKPGRSKLVMEN